MSEMNYSSSHKRTDFYKQIEKKSLTPLWEVMQDLFLPRPSSPCIPKIWKYDDIRKDISEAGDIISTEEAERRVLILENPVALRWNEINITRGNRQKPSAYSDSSTFCAGRFISIHYY